MPRNRIKNNILLTRQAFHTVCNAFGGRQSRKQNIFYQFFSRLCHHFERGVLTTIYSTLRWLRLADGIRSCVFLHVQSVRFGRGRHSFVFCSEPLLEQKLATSSLPRWMVSGRAEPTAASPTAAHRPTEPWRAKRAPPPANQAPTPDPRAAPYTPNTRSPALRLPIGKMLDYSIKIFNYSITRISKGFPLKLTYY